MFSTVRTPILSTSRPVIRPIRKAMTVTVMAANTSLAPEVKIDNRSDAFATVVEVNYKMDGQDAFLTEIVQTLKNLGMNIVKARLESKSNSNVFYVTEAESSDKVLKSAKIEEIRLAILDILSKAAPEGEQLSIRVAMESPEATKILGMRRVGIQTQVMVKDHPTGTHTVTRIITRDRPGLLTDVVRVLKDLNLNVISAEINTAGTTVDDVLMLTYQGKALDESMKALTTNALQYYLQLREIEMNESY